MLSPESIQEFKRIWLEERGEEISDEVALDYAVNLLTFFDAIYKPLKKDWVE